MTLGKHTDYGRLARSAAPTGAGCRPNGSTRRLGDPAIAVTINKGAFMCGLRYLRAPRAYPHYLGANERPMNAPREG